MDACCYIINLDRDVDRWRWMEARATALGLNYKRFPGVLGAKGDPAELYDHRRFDHLTPGEVGCLLSHVGVWKAIAEGEHAAGLVLEDDAHLSDELPRLLKGLSMTDDAFEVLKMEASPMGIDVVRRPVEVLAPYRIYKLRGPHQGTAAYLVNKATARKLLAHADEIARPIDMWLFDPAVATALMMDVRQVIPAPCIQDQYASAAIQRDFPSVIGARTTQERRPGEILRGVIRPLFRRALTLVRMSSGLARVGVTFR